MPKYHILMGDIVSSRVYSGRRLSQSFKRMINNCNKALSGKILSPYTITLGDEFQGVARSLRAAVDSIFYLEESVIKNGQEYKLRYVLNYGEIETTINKKTAHGMLGSGLTDARKTLTEKFRGKPRFIFQLPDEKLENQLTRLFKLADSVITRWKPVDYSLISEMIINDNDQEVGKKFGKNRSQIWKRRRHLCIGDYKIIKEVIYDLIA